MSDWPFPAKKQFLTTAGAHSSFRTGVVGASSGTVQNEWTAGADWWLPRGAGGTQVSVRVEAWSRLGQSYPRPAISPEWLRLVEQRRGNTVFLRTPLSLPTSPKAPTQICLILSREDECYLRAAWKAFKEAKLSAQGGGVSGSQRNGRYLGVTVKGKASISIF